MGFPVCSASTVLLSRGATDVSPLLLIREEMNKELLGRFFFSLTQEQSTESNCGFNITQFSEPTAPRWQYLSGERRRRGAWTRRWWIILRGGLESRSRHRRRCFPLVKEEISCIHIIKSSSGWSSRRRGCCQGRAGTLLLSAGMKEFQLSLFQIQQENLLLSLTCDHQ